MYNTPTLFALLLQLLMLLLEVDYLLDSIAFLQQSHL
jgi:hypothetical protein